MPEALKFEAKFVNDKLMQIATTVDGNYQGTNYFSLL